MAIKFVRFFVFSFTSIFLLGACTSSTTASVTPSAATSPQASPVTSPSAPSALLPGEVRGFGDTTTNPDATYICAASASLNGKIVAYMTVAGSDTAGGQSACTTLEQGGAWVAITTIP